MVRFNGAREKGAMVFVECLGVLQEDTMEAPLWRETLGRSLGSHDAAELVGGIYHGNGYRQETPRLHAISCTTGTRIGSGRAEEGRRSARNRKIVVDAMWETGET